MNNDELENALKLLEENHDKRLKNIDQKYRLMLLLVFVIGILPYILIALKMLLK